MKDEYIRREDAKNTLQEKVFHNLTDEFYGVMQVLDELEPADVAPVRRARWEHVKHKSVEHGEIVIDGETVRCSNCRHAEKGWSAGMNFCPNCGAKMDA